jgi:hypothetical protein
MALLYGRAGRLTAQNWRFPARADNSLLPPSLWRDAADPATRAFYGNLNERTRRYMAEGRVPLGNDRPTSGPDYEIDELVRGKL